MNIESTNSHHTPEIIKKLSYRLDGEKRNIVVMNCFEKLRKTMQCKFSDFTFAIKLMSEKPFKKQRMSIFKNAVRELFKSPKYPVVVHREANNDICEQLLESIKQASKEELITGGSGAGKSVYSKSSLEKELKNLKRSLKYGTGNHQHGGIQDR